MIYQSDPNTNRRSDIRDDALYTLWIIGGVVTLAIVIAAALSTGSNRDLDLPQITTTVLLQRLQQLAPMRPPKSGQPPAFSCEQFCTVSSLGVGLT